MQAHLGDNNVLGRNLTGTVTNGAGRMLVGIFFRGKTTIPP